MSRKPVFSPWTLLIAIVLFATAAFSQTTASIKGTVTDSTGAAIANAKVTATGTLGIDRTTQTNNSGEYEIPALPPGVYTVKAEKSGFQIVQAKNVPLQVSQNSVQNFSMKVATAHEVVEVEASTPVIETTTVTVGQVINQRTVQDIPLNGRHFVDLALLIPGTVTPPQNGFLTAPLRGQGSFAFNTAGSREDTVNFMINGINLNDMVQNQVTFQPTIATVAEFKVDNSTYSAEYGRNSGAIVNIATRSGTNQFHGEIYDYLRNDFFDARNAFNRTVDNAGNPLPINPFKRNQFGGDVGGPLYRDTTFFYASYEGMRHRQGLATASGVLSDAQRAQILAGTNTLAQALLPFIPTANGALSSGTPAFFGSATAPVNIDQGTADVSHNFSDADRLHGYYVYQADLRQESTALGLHTIPGFGDTREGHRQVLTLNETHVFSSNMVNEARLGANRILITFKPNNTTDPASIGVNLGPGAPLGLPLITITDLGLTFGSERNFPQGRGDTTAVLGDTLSYIRGNHSIKFGTEFRDFRNNNFNSDPGSLTFSTTANFINGTVNTAARTVAPAGNVANRLNVGALDFFVVDSYKFRPYLTFDLGLRYSWNMTPSDAQGRFVNFDPATVSLIQTSQPYKQNNKNFQPRLGFAWDVFHTGNTVLRAAYAYQVDQPISGVASGLSSNPPFALPIVVSNQPFTALGGLFTGTPANIAPLVLDPNFTNANVQSWNLNVQQQVTKSTGIMVGYFGTKGTHLEIDRNLNQFTVLGGGAATRPFQTLSASSPILPGVGLANSLTLRSSDSNSSYNALWVTANKRMSNGLQFNASYTWSHSIDEASRNLNGIVVQDSTNIAGSRGSSDFDARHRLVMNAIYDLPFKGNRLVSGWSLAPILSLQSGNPLTIIVTTNTITGLANSIFPNASAPLQVTGNALGNWFANPGVLSIPTGFGSLGRNAVVGPDFKNLDLSAIKNTKLTERYNLQLRVDAFDLFNHPNFGQPNRVFSPTSTSFGTITSTRFPTGDSGSSRQLQLAMKLTF